MRENRPYGSEGGEQRYCSPTPIGKRRGAPCAQMPGLRPPPERRRWVSHFPRTVVRFRKDEAAARVSAWCDEVSIFFRPTSAPSRLCESHSSLSLDRKSTRLNSS